MKKIVKYLGRTLLAILILLVVIVVLLYLPPVQNFLRRQAVHYISSHSGWVVEVGRFHLGFPLNLELEEVYAGLSSSDTLLYVGNMHLDIGLRRILRKELSINELTLNRAKLRIANDTTGMRLRTEIGQFTLRSRQINLKEKIAEIGYICLDSSRVDLTIGLDTLPDITTAQPFDWSFLVEKLEINRVGYRMSSPTLAYLGAGIESGQLAGGKVQIGRQNVRIDSLEISGGWCRIASGGEQPQTTIVKEDTLSPGQSWTIGATALRLENSAFRMDMPGKEKTRLVLSGIGIVLDSVYNRGTTVRATLRDLQAVQQDGVQLVSMQAKIALDSAESILQGGYICTLNSRILLQARADTSVQALLQQVPLKIELEGQLGLADIVPYYPEIPRELQNKTVNINTILALTGRQAQVEQLKCTMPGHFSVSGQGKVTDYSNIEQMNGAFTLEGDLQDVRFVQAFLKDTVVHIPLNMQLSARVGVTQGDFRASLRLCQGKGCLTLDGNYNRPQEAYAGRINLEDFPLGSFLPTDSLGNVTAHIRVEGHSFAWTRAKGSIDAGISQLTYRGHDYRDISLEAALNKTRFAGSLVSEDPSIPLDLIFHGDSVAQAYTVSVTGKIGNADLKNLHFVQDSLSVGMDVDIRATAAAGQRYALHARFDSLWMAEARKTYQLGEMTLNMDSDKGKTDLKLVSGDLNLRFQSDTSLSGFAAGMSSVAGVISRQVKEKKVDMQEVSRRLPDFNLEVTGAQKNVVAGFLEARHIGFRSLMADVGSRRRSGIRIGIQVNAPYFGTVRLDSVRVGAWQTGKSFVYNITAGSSAEAWKGLFNLNMAGRILGDQLRLELQQKNAQGEVGFDLGTNLILRDSSFTVSFFPMTPILGYSRWFVNADNQVTVYKDWKIKANLRMAYLNKLVNIQSLGDEGEKKDRLQVEFAGIDLLSLSRLVPFMPELEGMLSADLLLYFREKDLGVQGNINVDGLFYQKQRIGTLALGLQYNGSNRLTRHDVDFELKIDSIRRAVLKGDFSTSVADRHLAVDVDIPSFPLYVANAFLPDNVLKLGGELTGTLYLRRTIDNPQLDGELAFKEGKADVVMIGTAFRLDTASLAVENGKINFRHYRFIAPNNSDLVLDGYIGLTPFDRMGMDLSLKARNFEVVNVRKNETSLIYGKAYTDIDARMAGEFSSLSVTGNINLLNQTAITYTLRNSGPELTDKGADLVRFVSFRDTTLNKVDDLTNRVKLSSFMLKMLVEIGNQVSATVDLSEDGSNHVSIQGGGNLALSMNPESGLGLSGKYILNGGTVVYNIPIAGKKEFNIRSGSYVEWTGNVANPMLSISASESVKATVEDGDRNRLVTFDAIIRIQNTLTHPDITFDLSSPNDMVIQNQLATFSPEERTRQALNLLVYSTYTAPGAAKSGNSNVANNALYSFVENELNKYTRKAGITLGVDSYNTDENTVRRDFTYEFSRQLFNDRVRVKIGGRISTDNNEVQDNNLEDNLVDDISIEYMFTKKRNLYLRVFRHSNYESVLDGEVTQTGIGIVWRKNFQKFKDLFKGKKARHKNE